MPKTRRKNTLREIVEQRMQQQRTDAEERWHAIQRGTETIPTTHWAIARLNLIQSQGEIDRKVDGPGYRTYAGSVGTGALAEAMEAQITAYEGNLCICFWGADSRARRLLVTSGGDLWIEVWTKDGIKAIRHTGKYAAAWNQIAQVRPACGTNFRAEDKSHG